MPACEIVNLTSQSLGKLHSWLPHDLQAEKVVFLPDACPGKSPLPTGTAVLTRQADWRRFAVSDCGCGMRFVRSRLTTDTLSAYSWEKVADPEILSDSSPAQHGHFRQLFVLDSQKLVHASYKRSIPPPRHHGRQPRFEVPLPIPHDPRDGDRVQKKLY